MEWDLKWLEKMIIFDLDGTLADCEHRRHFIEAPEDRCWRCFEYLTDCEKIKEPLFTCSCGRQPGIWRKDWQAFYEACDQDRPIQPVINIFYTMQDVYKINNMQIWSGRCESVREKTIQWLLQYAHYDEDIVLKMRPIGDSTSDDQLKERWLDEALAQGNKVDFVFEDRPRLVRMYRRRGIFVFNCCQHEDEF